MALNIKIEVVDTNGAVYYKGISPLSDTIIVQFGDFGISDVDGKKIYYGFTVTPHVSDLSLFEMGGTPWE